MAGGEKVCVFLAGHVMHCCCSVCTVGLNSDISVVMPVIINCKHRTASLVTILFCRLYLVGDSSLVTMNYILPLESFMLLLN